MSLILLKVNKLKSIYITVLLCLTAFISYSQEQKKDSVYLGELSGQWRTYFLSTFNEGDLKDFYALATGGELTYEFEFGEYFKFGTELLASYNFGIQDLTIPDPVTGRLSRYESGLFNIEDLSKSLVIFPRELFFEINSPEHQFKIGRIKFISPFINPQDGRMIPTLEQGFIYKFIQPEYTVQFGGFNGIAPRSTAGFFHVGETIGKYPVGRQLNGEISQYEGNTESEYILFVNTDFKLNESLKTEVWNYYVDNIFNTFYLKPVYTFEDGTTSIAAEWLHQSKVGNGGNTIDSLRYFSDNSSNILGIQFSKKLNKSKLTLAYDYILPGGRFLFPREWGREFLFSFQKRERSEGSANNHAFVGYLFHTFNFKNHSLKTITSVGHHLKPDVTNAADNKYAQPDYTHINLDLFWETKLIKGFKPELLLTYKFNFDKDLVNPNLILNKVNMFQINAIVNYNF